MPKFAVYNNKLIYPSDIYKNNIAFNSNFYCLNCNELLCLRQSRGKNDNYVEHFYHPNPSRNGTHIECDDLNLNNIRKKKDCEWHNMMSERLKSECSEFFKFGNKTKHFVDGYDKKNELGIEFQNSQIHYDDIISREKITNLDWIFNVENQYIRYIGIGNYIAVEIPHKSWSESIHYCSNNVFLHTGYKEWLWLTDRESYCLELGGKRRHVWIIFKEDICSYKDVIENTCLDNILTEEGKELLKTKEITQKNVEKMQIAFARCKKSMFLLDQIHRNSLKKINFRNDDIVAVKSVAGSGKTTTLLELSKIHKNKRILYLAFNKNLINEIGIKLKNANIKNLFPRTFDSLMRSIYSAKKGNPQQIDELRPNTIETKISWFKNKNWRIKKQCIQYLTKFCRQIEYSNINDYCESKFGKEMPLLKMMWEKVVKSYITTFDSIRKIVHIFHWAKDYINSNYDMIFIDEAQDFDELMLDILIKDTSIPKLFVGDTMQAIYQWRGCINAFDKLPDNTLYMEFYSSYRVGDPACNRIRDLFDNCWMISKSKNKTYFDKIGNEENYVYLFRSWKFLLLSAQETNNIYIYGYDEKEKTILKLHERLLKYPLSEEEKQDMEDDLPNFLLSYSSYQLTQLLRNVKHHIVPKNKAKCLMYTIHSFKGCEHDNVKLCEDIIEDEPNLLYVALTRGMKKIDYINIK